MPVMEAIVRQVVRAVVKPNLHPRVSVATQRKRLDLLRFVPMPHGIRETETTLAGVPAKRLTPSVSTGAILYLHGGAVVDWPVSIAMEEAGFKDSFREMNPNPVANLGVTWLTDADSLETECRMDRIDFIYYQGKTIQAIASECYDNSLGKTFTFKGEDFFYPSDHGFVLSKFELD